MANKIGLQRNQPRSLAGGDLSLLRDAQKSHSHTISTATTMFQAIAALISLGVLMGAGSAVIMAASGTELLLYASTAEKPSPYWLNKSHRGFFDHIRRVPNLGNRRSSQFRIPSNNPLLKRRPNEPQEEWLARMNAYVFRGSDHCDAVERFVGPKDWTSWTSLYGIQVWGAVGCGLCGERAYWLASLLKNNGTQAMLLGLFGHVVTIVQDENTEKHWVLDPDYGVRPFLVDIASPSDMEISAASHYRFLHEAGEAYLYDRIVDFFATIDNNKFYTMRTLRSLEFSQSRWLYRLWPYLIHDLRMDDDPINSIGHDNSADSLRFAMAVHALLVAAERKYGQNGYRKPVVELTPLDFIIVSPESNASHPNHRRIEITNFGYRAVTLQATKTDAGDCSFPVHSGSNGIRLLPHSSYFVEINESCVIHSGPSPSRSTSLPIRD